MHNTPRLKMLSSIWKHQDAINIDDDTNFICGVYTEQASSIFQSLPVKERHSFECKYQIHGIMNGIMLSDITNGLLSLDLADKVKNKYKEISNNPEAFSKKYLSRELNKNIRERFDYSFFIENLPYCVSWSMVSATYLSELVMRMMDATFPLKYFRVTNEIITLFVKEVIEFISSRQEFILSHDFDEKLNEKDSRKLIKEICEPLMDGFTI
ncbi:hypothetical protein [Photobacterium leiognathi]|uniref:hypothetical protein n=1 Tax=Photobacterium leiognathi TaxID=553611 RepID=UPI002980C24B|nr:hypothetical protein [Photobacterium leiognathi]